MTAWEKHLEKWEPNPHNISLARAEIHEATVADLKTLAQSQAYLPFTANPPIHILGPLEAQGLCFDRQWCMSFGETTWPPRGAPDPFLPPTLQVEQGMPGSAPKIHQAFYRSVTENLLCSAEQIVLSTAAGSELSPLIQQRLTEWTEAGIVEFQHTPHPQSTQATSLQEGATDLFEEISDPRGLPFSQTKAPGGTGLLKNQAACPFRAYAQFRLGATPPENKEIGVTPLQRGVWIHDILEVLWRKLKSQAALQALTKEMRENLVQDCVTNRLNKLPESELPPPLKKLEIHRLNHLMEEWLSLEQERPPFSVVALEKQQSVTYGDLQFTVKTDRIDSVNNKLLILDYKTGNAQISNWFGERPLDPQLPFYAASAAIPVAGIGFAFVHDTPKFHGIATEGTLVSGLMPYDAYREEGFPHSWEAQCTEWSDTLTQLAHEFSLGIATVTPTVPEKTCATCHLHGLCRIQEHDTEGM